MLIRPAALAARRRHRRHSRRDHRRLRAGPRGEAKRRPSVAGSDRRHAQLPPLRELRRDRTHDRAHRLQSARHSAAMLARRDLGMALLYLLPFVLLFTRDRRLVPLGCRRLRAHGAHLSPHGSLLRIGSRLGAHTASQRHLLYGVPPSIRRSSSGAAAAANGRAERRTAAPSM